jgi:hypothetical protein
VISGPLHAIERLDDLVRLFEYARRHAQSDAIALSEMLDQAQSILADIAPAMAAARDTPHELAVLQAALRANASHRALSDEMGFEVARLASELGRLTAGVQATDRYMPASPTLGARPLDLRG